MAGGVLVNGEVHDCIPSSDRGLAYGDGLFETIALREGRPTLWQAHLARLTAGAAQLGIPMPDPAVWCADLAQVLPAEPVQRMVLKLTLTRGSAGRGYAPPADANPTRILQLFDWPAWPADHAEAGITARVCSTRLGLNPALAGVKHLNRLEQVLAARETAAAGVDEGLMLDSDGRLVEGVRTNVFLVADGVLLTPGLHRCGIRGVMRDCLMAGAGELGIPVSEEDCQPALLQRASEIFVCNSLIGLWPIRTIKELGRPSLAPGPVTRSLQAWLGAKDLTQ